MLEKCGDWTISSQTPKYCRETRYGEGSTTRRKPYTQAGGNGGLFTFLPWWTTLKVFRDGKSMKQFRNTPYMVDDSGHVFRKGKAKCLKPDISPKGYKRVTLCINGVKERFLVHRIVAEVFIGLNPDKEYVNHKDSNPSNNHVANLEWCIHSENMLHSHSVGTCSNQIASNKASEIKTLETELKFRNLLGANFIRVENVNPRNFVVFNCPSCSKEMKCRVDSTTLQTAPISCKACKLKMKI